MNHEGWLKHRTKGLGGSEVSALFGINPFRNNIQLWQEKAQGKSFPIDSELIEYGSKAEAPLRELFKLDYPQYDVQYKDFDCVQHPEYPFIRGTVDGRLTDRKTGEHGILEIKTCLVNNGMQWLDWDGKVKQNYFIQVLWYLLCTGYSFAVLKAQLKTNYDGNIKSYVRHYYINTKDCSQDIEIIKGKAIYFWKNHVETGVEPSLVLPKI